MEGEEGGIEAWPTWRSVRLNREDIVSLDNVLPGVRFAVDAYINFAKGIVGRSSLLIPHRIIAPEIHKKRLENWPQHYNWIKVDGYSYFRKRLSEARRDC